MQMPARSKLLPAFDQAFVDRIELVGVLRNDAALDRLLQPAPLEHRGLEDRGRRVGVVFEQFRRPCAVEGQIEPAIEAAFVALPAVRDQRPEGFRDFQPLQIFLVADRLCDQREAHLVDLAGRRLDAALDLIQREGVVAALVPVTLVVDGVEVEAASLRALAPVVALGADDALHGGSYPPPPCMSMAAAAMAMPVDMMQRAAEAAVPGRAAAIEAAVAAGHRGLAGTAAAPRRKSHRNGADRRRSHHRQHDPA